MKTTPDSNPITDLQAAKDQIAKLQSQLASRDASINEYRQLEALRGLDLSSLPAEVQAMAHQKMEMGLSEPDAVRCALKQYNHDQKLAEQAKVDAVVEAERARVQADIDQQAAKEASVLQAITREILSKAGAAA